jgi:Right handed beta helix region
LAIWFEQRATVRIAKCHSVTFSNVTVRHGDTSITVADCEDVRLDHVNVYAGNDGIKLRGTCNGVTLTNVLVDGGLPPWYFRSDRKDEFNLASDPTSDKAQAPGQNTMKSLLSGTANCHDSVVRNCEFVSGHDLFTFGTGLRFSRNWIQNLDDDAIVIDTDGSADLQIFENVIEQCQTVLSSGGGAGSGTSVFRNLIDLRRPFAKSRPSVYEQTSCDDTGDDRRTLDVGVLVKTRPPDGPLNFFHNTCLVRDNQADASFNHFSGWGTSRRQVFNNIFVAVNTVPGSDKPISFLPNVDLPGELRRRGHRRQLFLQDEPVPLGSALEGAQPRQRRAGVVRDARGLPRPADAERPLHGQPDHLRPGFEASSIEADPQFRRFGPAHLVPAWHDDFRLRAESAVTRARR